jgi:hypothetical protein
MKNLFFGKYLLSKGIVSPAKLAAATEYQKRFNSRIGEYAVSLGLLRESDLDKINQVQLTQDLLFGEAALKLGLLQNKLLHELVAAQRIDHVMLGEALVALGYATKQQIDDALADFLKEQEEYMQTLFELPEDIPFRDAARLLFRLTHHLLVRAWNLTNKPGDLEVVEDTLLLSDHNAGIALSGGISAHFILGVPHTVLEEEPEPGDSTDPAPPDDDDHDERVAHLADIICHNFVARSAHHDHEVVAGEPHKTDFRLELDAATRAALMPFHTPQGQVFAAIVF